MKVINLTLVMLGMSDEPEWCEPCALPSLVRVHYVIERAGAGTPGSVRSFTACTDCGRQGR